EQRRGGVQGGLSDQPHHHHLSQRHDHRRWHRHRTHPESDVDLSTSKGQRISASGLFCVELHFFLPGKERTMDKYFHKAVLPVVDRHGTLLRTQTIYNTPMPYLFPEQDMPMIIDWRGGQEQPKRPTQEDFWAGV